MSQYPITTVQGVFEAVNYMASGPSGLGQNFQGFSSYKDAYLTGNFRKPYSQGNVIAINVPPVTCNSAVQLGDSTFQYNFSTTQSSPPFGLGNNLTGSGWANDFYNGYQGAIGAIKCTDNYVIFQTTKAYPGIGNDLAGGNVYVDNMSHTDTEVYTPISTDCNARVVVNGGTDRVFIGSQMTTKISYVNPGSKAANLTYKVQVNRYSGTLNQDPVNPDYLFVSPVTIFQKTYTLAGLTGSATLPEIETIFSTVIDQPNPGYYWYILELVFDTPSTSGLYVTTVDLGLRSLSAQVVKQ